MGIKGRLTRVGVKAWVMRRARRGAIGAALLFALALLANDPARAQSSGLGPLLGDEPSYLDFGGGAFNIQGHQESQTIGEGRIELRYGQKLFYIGPAIGLLANTAGGVFGYAGIYSDLAFGPLVLTGFGGAGGYDRGHDENLGGDFEFRLSAGLAYEFGNKSRLGVQFAHISNAGIHDRNPGENELLLTYSIPLRLPF